MSIKKEIYEALADYQTIVASRKATKPNNTAWLSIRQLIDMSSDETSVIGYRIKVIEMKDKFIQSYANGLEVNPEEVADLYKVIDVSSESELEITVSRLIPNLDLLIDYRYSEQRYPS